MSLAILSLKPNHDGAVAGIIDGKLVFSIEAEKNSRPRYSWLTPGSINAALRAMPVIPDVVCLSGWDASEWRSTGYWGIEKSASKVSDEFLFGKPCKYFSSSHERSHLIGTFGLSNLAVGTPCYSLLWEGGIGCFYEIDENLSINRLGQVLSEPGERYAFLYHLTKDTDEPFSKGGDAGKLMALAAFSDRTPPNSRELEFLDRIFGTYHRYTHPKQSFKDSPYFNIGEEHEWTKQLAGKLSDAIFNNFLRFAEEKMTKRLPLLISGGCGLNCEWNSKWRASGLFPEVFVTPIANDSGSAIGTAIDAQFHLTGNPKIEWSVYSGEEFEKDCAIPEDHFKQIPFTFQGCAQLLAEDKILGWIQGKYEIGPRALGNRSILAAPFSSDTSYRLNQIKQREQYRPIAPVCRAEDASLYFELSHESPYMLFFAKVRHPLLRAVTHVDRSARPQTVTEQQNSQLYSLLEAFGKETGVGVLCNTSLNFSGKGFINQTSDLLSFVAKHKLDGFVLGDSIYLAQPT